MNRKINIYLDFDGTIIDVFPRYYGILTEYISSKNNDQLDYFMYKELKRLGKKDHVIVRELLNNLEFDINDYVNFKRENLEKFSWLRKDIIIGDPITAFNKLKRNGYRIILLTQRNNEITLFRQLNYLKIRDEFDEVVMLKPKYGLNVKAEYLKKFFRPNDIIVGDSYVEIEVSKLLNIKGFFVDSGLFSSRALGINKNVFADYMSVIDYILKNDVNKGVSDEF
jgi:phosphoglycolate phosphatase-like HAD superfamily hydrolase